MDQKNNKGKKVKSYAKGMLECTLTFGFAVVISTFISSTVFAMPMVKQNSMQNTLFEGQKLFEYKLGYLFSEPKRGDIVIVNRVRDREGLIQDMVEVAKEACNNLLGSSDQNRLVKRVIGIPGDIIDIKNDYVYLNGEKLNEYYVKGKTYPNSMTFPLEVPKGKYFVMGDNREVSLDSRDLGLFDCKQIEGKALCRIWPINKIGSIYSK